jgi:6-phosphogluconolactonase
MSLAEIGCIGIRIGLVLFILTVNCARADELPFYIGTYTGNGSTSQGIYRDSIDSETGKLGTPTLAVATKDPSFLALSPDNQFLFACQGDAVGSFKIGSDGLLTLINQQPSGGGGAHVCVDKTGHSVFIANYGGGNVTSFPVGADGTIGARASQMQLTGSGPYPGRQDKSYAHSVYVDPTNQFLYSCDLGSDSVWTFKFDPNSAVLTPADPAKAKVPPGSGPRHLAFGLDGKFVYVINEMGHSVTVFSRDVSSGALTAVQTLSTLKPGTYTQTITAAEIYCHPSGKWLYTSTRGVETLSVFSIGHDGKLKLIQTTPPVVNFPRGFGIDPTGHWLIDAGQKDNRIAVFKIDQATGKLTFTGQTESVGVPVCILFMPKK